MCLISKLKISRRVKILKNDLLSESTQPDRINCVFSKHVTAFFYLS